jgi:hypothetical protein
MEIKTKWGLEDELWYADSDACLYKAKVIHITIDVYRTEINTVYEVHIADLHKYTKCAVKHNRLFKTKEDFYKFVIEKNKDKDTK